MSLSIEEIAEFAQRLDASALPVRDGKFYKFQFKIDSVGKHFFEFAKNEWPLLTTAEETESGLVISFQVEL